MLSLHAPSIRRDFKMNLRSFGSIFNPFSQVDLLTLSTAAFDNLSIIKCSRVSQSINCSADVRQVLIVPVLQIYASLCTFSKIFLVIWSFDLLPDAVAPQPYQFSSFCEWHICSLIGIKPKTHSRASFLCLFQTSFNYLTYRLFKRTMSSAQT